MFTPENLEIALANVRRALLDNAGGHANRGVCLAREDLEQLHVAATQFQRGQAGQRAEPVKFRRHRAFA